MREVLIAGAGIGGLTLAVALLRGARERDWAVRVVERAAHLLPVGAGITVQSNAMTALRRLDLDDAVRREGAEIEEAAILDERGGVLSAAPLGEWARELGAPCVALHRARLHRVLLEAAGADGARVDIGVSVTGYEARGERVRVHLSDGGTAETDLLVGADGLRSAVRARMVKDGEPVYAGYTSWRGVTPRGDLAPPHRTTETWGRGARFGIVPIGHGQVYWFATAQAAPGQGDGGATGELLERFGGWHPPIRELLESTPGESILRTDIADRAPLSRWRDGRVVLLGDAAHPMTPNLGQGGCQAIEDAVVLAECLAGGAAVAAALAEYEERRLTRANGIVLASRRLGALGQWSHPAACALRDMALRLTPRSAMRRRVLATLTFPR